VEASVLVVDDEERLAEMVATALRLEGYQAVVALDGAQALELVRTRSFDVLLTDLLMPDLNGDAVAAQASRLQPEMRLLLMTASRGVGESSVPWSAVIRKPFSLDRVVRAVAAATTGRRRPVEIPASAHEPRERPSQSVRREPT
jgi:DNA-binding NtrC family response regulator